MDEPLKLTPFFISEEDGEYSNYLAGLRQEDEEPVVQIQIDPELVERAVLPRAQLFVELDFDGLVKVWPDGFTDEARTAASKAGHLPKVTLLSLIEKALSPEEGIWEEFTASSLASLREQLVKGVELIDQANKELK